MPTTPTGRNTASATIAAAAAPRRARLRRASPPAPIARKILGPGIGIRGALVQMGPHAIDRARWDWDAIDDNPFWCPDRDAAQRWEGFLDGVRKAGSSTGAVIEMVASGVPVGLGEPIYGKLDADLASAMMGINAVKGVEIGAGFAAASLSGEENADEMRMAEGARQVSLQQRRRHPGRHLDRAGHRRALRREADELDPDRRGGPWIWQETMSRSQRKAGTIPASASAPCRSAKR